MPEAPEAATTTACTAPAVASVVGHGPTLRREAPAENRRLWHDVALVAGLALAVRLLQIDRPPQFDELYHVLAARSWAHDGTLTVGGGSYTRAAGFTILIGVFFKVLGDGLLVARLPSIIAGTVWVGAVHRWTGRRAGRLAGGIAGLLFGLDPGGIFMSGFARFYALQGVFVWLGAAALYDLIDERRTGWAAARSGLVMGVTWLAALYLQVTTLIALAGMGMWAMWCVVARLRAGASRDPRARRALAMLGALLALGIAAAAASGVLGKLYILYRQTPIWGEPTKNDWHWYERWFLQRYTALWMLLPLAAATALLARRRPAGFASIVFTVPFILFSGAALKSERYIYFVVPFFFVIWAITLADWLPRIGRFAARIVASLAPAGWSRRARTAALWAVVGIFGGWFVVYDPAFGMTRQTVMRDWNAPPYQESDWAHAAPELRRLADSADVVISTALPKTLYYVDRADVTLSLTELGELGQEHGKPIEFSIDARTGRPAVSSPESLERIMACYSRGLVLIEDRHWHDPVVIPDSTRAFLAAHTEEVPLPAAWLLHARRWTSPRPASKPGCPPWRTRHSTQPEATQ